MTDQLAEKMIRRIKDLNEETDRLISICKAQIEEYKQDIESYEQRRDEEIASIEAELRAYFETVPHRMTATQAVYDLPSGALRLKAQSPEFRRDDETVIKSLRDAGATDEYIQVKTAINWTRLKADIHILEDGTCVHTGTGTVIEGLHAVEREPKFVVEVK